MEKVNYIKLLSFSNDKSLFREELIKIVNSLDKEKRFDLLTYCYKHFSDKFPDVLLEVFYPQKNSDDIINASDNVLDQRYNMEIKGSAQGETK